MGKEQGTETIVGLKNTKLRDKPGLKVKNGDI